MREFFVRRHSDGDVVRATLEQGKLVLPYRIGGAIQWVPRRMSMFVYLESEEEPERRRVLWASDGFELVGAVSENNFRIFDAAWDGRALAILLNDNNSVFVFLLPEFGQYRGPCRPFSPALHGRPAVSGTLSGNYSERTLRVYFKDIDGVEHAYRLIEEDGEPDLRKEPTTRLSDRG